MFLKLCSPSSRNRKYWTVRGTYKGQRYDRSTGQTVRSKAQEVAEQFEREIREHEIGGESVTFEGAARAYIDFRKPSDRDRKWLEEIIDHIGYRPIKKITQHEIVAVANNFYPRETSASKNRAIIRPFAAVMHYAAKNKWCDWLRVETFREPTPETRYVGPDVEKALHMALRGKGISNRVNKRLALVWLFNQGSRISDMLNVTYEDIDFRRGIIRHHISKSDRYEEFPVDPVILRFLKSQKVKTGYIFLWRTRHAVNKWVREINKRAGVHFTPHMARHTLGKRLNDSGVALKTIMQILGQKDPKSAMRYQTTDIETMRRAKIGARGGVMIAKAK